MKINSQNSPSQPRLISKAARPLLYAVMATLALMVAIMWGAITGVAFEGFKQNQPLEMSEPEPPVRRHDPWEVSFVGREYDMVNDLSIFSYYIYAKDKLAVDHFSVAVPMDTELEQEHSNAGASLGIDVRALIHAVKLSQLHQAGVGKMYRFAIKGQYDIGEVEVSVSAGTHMMKFKRPGPVPWSLKEYYQTLSEQMDKERRLSGNAARAWRIEPFGK